MFSRIDLASTRLCAPACSGRQTQGFSLVELMAVVAIAGILLAVGIPAYSNYVVKSRIQAAQNALLVTANDVRQYAQDHETYVGSCTAPVAAEGFQISCPTLTQTTYTVQALGTGSLAGFLFTLDQTGARVTAQVPAGWAANPACWIADQQGDCAVE
ncbi:type IV pilin protein [Thiomonas sp. FB-Cd]|uniref:type IV pilin protein n=1 Tax=Thiomonas sp. FB-Cd TaxID=1158292 RepID=UPI0012DCB8C5|nr:type IV pilin protein [Thiomonas sp. FB-Cd]